MTLIEILQRASELGLKLGCEQGDVLTVTPADRCPPDFAKTLKAHKWHLLGLLSLPFCMAFSTALSETVFFTEDEGTKATLVEAGGDPDNVYTRDELGLLVEARRMFNAEPVSGETP
jgi:hypothetical protein